MQRVNASRLHGREHYAVPTKLYGVFRGIVENCCDPLAMGRIQVRVPSVHGILPEKETDDHIPTLSLPWASLVSYSGGHYDTGAQITYPCGSMVAVCFEGGSHLSPIILGSYSFNCHQDTIPVTSDPKDRWPEYKVPLGGGTTKTVLAATNPSEGAMVYVFSPTRGVLHKSFKGHTIWYEDKDSAECFEILDRCGQGMRMECNVSYSDNKDNKSARRLPSTFSEHKFDDISPSRVMFRDNGLDEIKLEVYDKSKSVSLKSDELVFKLQGTRDKSYWGHPKNDIGIEVDAESNLVKIKSKNIVIDGDVKITGELLVSGNASFLRLVKSYVRMAVNEINVKEHPAKHELF